MLAQRSILLFAFLILAFSGLAHAQTENGIGLTEGQGWYQDWCVEGPGTQVYPLYIYLENPINWGFNGNANHAVENIGGIECELSATMGATILEVRFPVPAMRTDYWVDGPVRLMQTTGLPTDQATWDSVKATYR